MSTSATNSTSKLVRVRWERLLPAYDLFILDVQGVLLDGDTPLPGAVALMASLRRYSRLFYVVTNQFGAGQSAIAEHLCACGIGIEPHEILTPRDVLRSIVTKHSLGGRPTCVIGSEEEKHECLRAGLDVVRSGERFETLVVGSADISWDRPTLEEALSALVSAGRVTRPRVILPNPDCFFPKGDGRLGLAPGAVASALAAAYLGQCNEKLEVIEVGKPAPHLFREALRSAGAASALVLGDQVATDIAAARAAHVDSILVSTSIVVPESSIEGAHQLFHVGSLRELLEE